MFSQARKTPVEPKQVEKNKTDQQHTEPAILTSGVIIDTVYRAPHEVYEYLTSPKAQWSAITNGEGLAFKFQQMTLGQTIFGWQDADHERGIEGGLIEYVIKLNYFDPAVNKVASSKEGLHNHFRPLGILPIALDGISNEEAYQMKWVRVHEKKVIAEGIMSIPCGKAYGIEDHLKIYHAVHTTRAHISVAIGQIYPEPMAPAATEPGGLATSTPLLPPPEKKLNEEESLKLKNMFVNVLGLYLAANANRIAGC
jgi:hypothetical protein